MKILWIGILFALPFDVMAQTADTVTIAADYSVQITNLWHLGSVGAACGWIGQLLGMAPKHLSYSEVDIDSAGANRSFEMSLTGQSGGKWLLVHSDTCQPSLIDPTQVRAGILSKAYLGSAIIGFVAGIRDFFRCDSAYSFHGRFVLWKDTVDFYAVRDTLVPGIYQLSSFNARGEPYIRGSVLVARKNGYNIYPWMQLNLLKPGTGVVLKVDGLKVIEK